VFEGMFISLAQAAPPGQSAGGGIMPLILLFVVLFGIMYVFMILPQKRREKQRRQMISSLRKNDHIVTIGGVYGVVTSLKDDRITIRVDDNKDVKLTVTPNAVASVSRPKEDDEEEKTQEEK